MTWQFIIDKISENSSFFPLKYRFKYVSNGAEVEEEAPWNENEPNNAGDGEGCVISKLDGGWNDVKCTNNAYALCQMPGMSLNFINNLILLSYIEHFNVLSNVMSQHTSPVLLDFENNLILSLYFFFLMQRKEKWWFDPVVRKIWLDPIL